MADLSDVQTALVNVATQAVYPNGMTQPSVANGDVMLYAGWPVKAQLDNDLLAGKAHVSVFSPPGMERNTTRYLPTWQEAIIPDPTLTLTVNNNTVVVGGVVTVPQTGMVIANDIGYAYAVQPSDTLESIATQLAEMIPGATAEATTITVSDAHSLDASVSVPGTAVKELKRQERVFMISVWASDPTVRSILGSAIDVLFAQTERFVLPDNVYARLTYHTTSEIDSLEKSRLYRRDLHYRVEYATTQTITNTLVVDSYLNSLVSGQTGLVNLE